MNIIVIIIINTIIIAIVSVVVVIVFVVKTISRFTACYCIQEEAGSNLGRDAHYHDWSILQSLEAIAAKNRT
jgi:hypothetical protein